MQTNKNRNFWDDFYLKSQTNTKEWIVHPTHEILQHTARYLPTNADAHAGADIENVSNDGNDDHFNILEIGCGNSLFSLVLWEFLIQSGKSTTSNSNSIDISERSIISVTATDVSPVCIEKNIERDSFRIQSNLNASISQSHSFHYKILNVLEPNDSHCLSGKHAIILDKGCLDTFLFRSENTKCANHSPSLRALLDNVHSWLKDDGKYLIFSPRKKIKTVRDFMGFASVQRSVINSVSFQLGDLDGKRGEKSVSVSGGSEKIHLYICTKNNFYQKGDPPFRNERKIPGDDQLCPKCGIMFIDFRNGNNASGKEMSVWARRFTGHCIHCTGK